MRFEKRKNSDANSMARNWTPCPNCGYKDDNPRSAEYNKRSAINASQRNADKNGKGCVS